MARNTTQTLSERHGMSRRDWLVGTAIGAAGAGLLGWAPPAEAMSMTSAPQIALNKAMRRLWEEHVAWTRMYIVSFSAGLPDATATATRLLRNQVDIGNAVKPFYGNAAGNKLAALLKQHILGAVAVLTAAKAGDTARLKQANGAWYANADQIAAFLHSANPTHWPLPAMQAMMHRHLALTTNEAVAQLQGHYGQSVMYYDRVEREILAMADMLTAGIIAQFPTRFQS